MPRLYWLGAAMLLATYWRPVPLTAFQIALLAVAAAAIVTTLRRALGVPPLPRVLRATLSR